MAHHTNSMCPATARDCPHPMACTQRKLCACLTIAPIDEMLSNEPRPMLHFVGFNPAWHRADMRLQNAMLVWGPPDFVHRTWDRRAADEIAPGDMVVFASGGDDVEPHMHAWDDSHADIVAHGGEFDR